MVSGTLVSGTLVADQLSKDPNPTFLVKYLIFPESSATLAQVAPPPGGRPLGRRRARVTAPQLRGLFIAFAKPRRAGDCSSKGWGSSRFGSSGLAPTIEV